MINQNVIKRKRKAATLLIIVCCLICKISVGQSIDFTGMYTMKKGNLNNSIQFVKICDTAYYYQGYVESVQNKNELNYIYGSLSKIAPGVFTSTSSSLIDYGFSLQITDKNRVEIKQDEKFYTVLKSIEKATYVKPAFMGNYDKANNSLQTQFNTPVKIGKDDNRDVYIASNPNKLKYCEFPATCNAKEMHVDNGDTLEYFKSIKTFLPNKKGIEAFWYFRVKHKGQWIGGWFENTQQPLALFGQPEERRFALLYSLIKGAKKYLNIPKKS